MGAWKKDRKKVLKNAKSLSRAGSGIKKNCQYLVVLIYKRKHKHPSSGGK